MSPKHLVGVVGLASVLLAVPASAHHSFAMFDMTKTVSLTGTIKDLQWTNPHVWVQIVVPTPKGAQEWGIEGGPVAMLKKKGLSRESVHPGDHVILVAHPLRSGQPGGSLMAIKRPDGSTIFSEMM